MDKIKEINEFNSILDYYKYLEQSLIELTEKENNTSSNKLKEFYSEQLDVAMKRRNTIRSVVFAKKNKILHDKVSNIKEQQVNDFINTKKEERNALSKKKIDLELKLNFYKSVNDFYKDFIRPIAEGASSYNCSDFYVSDEAFNKSYLFKDSDGNLGEFTGLMILSKYLNGNFSVLNKITKRHEIKERILQKYIADVKEKYPDYEDNKIYELASENLVSHSPEFLDNMNKKYDYTSNEYNALADAYKNFSDDYKSFSETDLSSIQSEINNINAEIRGLSNIYNSTNIEEYILKEFDEKQARVQMFKTASETLASDNDIAKYINKNSLIKSFVLSPETKGSYEDQLKEQNRLLDSIRCAENSIIENENTINSSKRLLNRLKNSQKTIDTIGLSEKAIKEISSQVEEYNKNYVIPLNKVKQEFESFKNSQELGLVPYQKVGFFQKIAGFFNGRNKIQAAFNNRCREYESNIKVLSNKAAINKPDYNFTNDNNYKKEIGNSIKQYIFEHPDCSEYSACKRVLNSYSTDLNRDILNFKTAYSNSIDELDNCFSYHDICKCVVDKIDNVKQQIELEKSKQQELATNKTFLCSKYNENSSMPISPVASATQIVNTQNEFKKQLGKLFEYKGENPDLLNYKIQVENLLENDNSFLSETEIKDLNNSAYKTAESIIQEAATSFINNNEKK